MRIVLGPGSYEQSDTGLRAALRAGHRDFDVQYGVYMKSGINLDEFDGSLHLAFTGQGFHTSNFVKMNPFPTPMLYSLNKWWQLFWQGFCFQGQNKDDQPLTHFNFVDRFFIRDVGYYDSAGQGAEWATNFTNDSGHGGAGGSFGLGTIDGVEVMRCGKHGWNIGAGRNLTFQGRCRFERNGQKNPGLYNGLRWTGNPANANSRVGHGSLKGIQFEHDNQDHVGLYLRNLRGMAIGENRHVLAGYDCETADSDYYPSTVYEGSKRRVSGKGNRGVSSLTGKVKNDLILPVQPENG